MMMMMMINVMNLIDRWYRLIFQLL